MRVIYNWMTETVTGAFWTCLTFGSLIYMTFV